MARSMRLSDTRMAALFLVSVVVLAFEILVMRVFSVASWSNFGSMVISIALLGFGVAGTLITILGKRIRANPDGWLSVSAYALGPSIALAYTVAQRIPFNPVLIVTDPSQLWWIAAYYLLYGLPFFVGALFIGTIFSSLSSQMHTLYFWNMLGSGLGGLIVLGLMFLLPTHYLIYPVLGASLLAALLCTVRWSAGESRFRIRGMEVILSLALALVSVVLPAQFGALNVSDFKPESYARNFPDSKIVYENFSPRGEMRVFESSFFHFAPGLSDNAGATLAHMPKNAFEGLYIDGEGPVGVMRKLSPEEEAYIDFLPMSAPYLLLSRPKVLELRLGGSAGVQTALHNGASQVWVVESNPDLVHMLRDVPYFQSYTGRVLQDPRVRLVNNEVRAFAGSTRDRFDLVEIGLVDSIGLSQAGGYSVEENYLYTEEAIREYLRCLAPGGVLSITVWDRLSPPRNVPKLMTTIVEAMRQEGITRPDQRIFAFNLLLSTATVLVKNGDFTPSETETLAAYCKRMSFDADYYPGIGPAPVSFATLMDGYAALYADPNREGSAAGSVPLRPNDLYRLALHQLLFGSPSELYDRYVFDIRPATDDKPYYSGYLKLPSIPMFLRQLGDISEEWGYLLLLATLLQSLIFGALVVLLPMASSWRELFRGRQGTFGIIVYYGFLGLAYMMAEIYLIQRFVYYLADPVYVNSLVIALLLIASGIGSLVSTSIRGRKTTIVLLATVGIAACAAFYAFGMSPILRATLGLPLAVKALVAAACIAPLGLLLGVPFPTGLASLSASRRGVLPWAWGVNGALSVTGSVLTRIVSTSLGFRTVLACMAVLYLGAGLLFRVNERGKAEEAVGLKERAGGIRERAGGT
ncbi:MAG TPA: hypothetical protein VFH83_11605 [Spirochaetia bacterium]|nr:hypothetical protein [Spirochaetia bacterium]